MARPYIPPYIRPHKPTYVYAKNTIKQFGRVFCQDLEEMTFFARLQQIAQGFLLQIHLLLRLYGSWSRKYDPGIADQGTDAARRARMQRGGHMGRAH